MGATADRGRAGLLWHWPERGARDAAGLDALGRWVGRTRGDGPTAYASDEGRRA
ncbi:hypothetical protein [Halorussus caseinilyticus]|uniref:Uncharacterized protein n=1 Tax=Halorussus caseinilyticus TaxID=3034025 RepID=A0ABD5WMM4_9EURY|nr:hypothetical protein [Halorussus sp. DT72]